MKVILTYVFIIDDHADPDLEDIAQAFEEMDISITELSDYTKNIDNLPPASCIQDMPRFPVCVSSQLNFPKVGSKEVVERNAYIDEYLPCLHPELEGK